MHEDPRLGEFRQHDRVARPDHRLRVLQEHVERPRLALRVLPVIGDAAEDLARPRQRRPQPHRAQRQRLAVAARRLERRPQPVEIVDEPCIVSCGVWPFSADAGDIDDAALGQQPGCRLGVPRGLKKHQSHVIPSPNPVGRD